MKILVFLIIITISEIACFGNLNVTLDKLINDFVFYKNLKFLTLLTCFNPQDSIRLYKNINNVLYISSNFYSEEEDYTEFLRGTQLGFLLDTSCSNYEEFVYQAKIRNTFHFPYKWFIIDPTNTLLTNYSFLLNFFSKLPLRLDSDVTTFIKFENGSISFYDVYKPGIDNNDNNDTVKVSLIGFWSDEDGIVPGLTTEKYQQRKNLTDIVIPCGIVKTHSDKSPTIESYFRRATINNFDTINKFCYTLYAHLQEIHNFSCEPIVVDKWFGNAWGGIDDGLAKLLHEKRVELGISSGLLKPDRIPLIDFIAPAYPFRTCFIFRNPRISTKVQNEFLKPFKALLWYTLFGFIVFFCIIFRFSGKLSKTYKEKSWTATCLLTWSIICQQGATFIPTPTSGRCTLLSLLVMSLLLYNYYTSSIVSSLLSGLPPPFKTIEELSKSYLEVGVEDAVYTRTFFEVTQDERIKYLYKHKVLAHHNQPAYMGVADGIAKVKSGGFAYHSEPVTAYPIIESTFEPYEICELAEINMFTPTVLWVMMQKRGQYNKMFEIGYLRMLECGIIARQRSIWIAKKPACLANMHLVEVGMQSLLSAFLVLIFGGFVSLLLLILEIARSKYKNKLLSNSEKQYQ